MHIQCTQGMVWDIVQLYATCLYCIELLKTTIVMATSVRALCPNLPPHILVTYSVPAHTSLYVVVNYCMSLQCFP